jgi:hypothetical protein
LTSTIPWLISGQHQQVVPLKTRPIFIIHWADRHQLPVRWMFNSINAGTLQASLVDHWHAWYDIFMFILYRIYV